MTARVWTVEALDVAHPEVRAAGWDWRMAGGTVWAESGASTVFINEHGALVTGPKPPAPVCLAVILASRGMDSLGAMAAALDVRAESLLTASTKDASRWSSPTMLGRAYEAADCAAMLRRGTVAP